MLPYQTLLKIDKSINTPVYQQISNQLVSLIRDGVVKPGSPLPASREMATLLSVHRNTIVAAYDDLLAQDWIITIPRKGVVVSPHLPTLKPSSFDLSNNLPAYAGTTGFIFEKIVPYPKTTGMPGEHWLMINDGFPDSRIAPTDSLLREYRSLSRSIFNKFNNNQVNTTGSLMLRTELVKFLGESRGLNFGLQNILLTHGAQMAIYIAAKLLVRPNSQVLVGELNYFVADVLFKQFGAQLVKVPIDENGMDVDFIEAYCKKRKPDLLYIIPHHHHPTTVTLSSERRMRLLEIIRQYNIPVIEDDYDYDFHYNGSPILPLASAHHGGNVIYIGSLAKLLSTSVRVGYMIAPEDFITEAALVRTILDFRNDHLFEGALAYILKSGEMARHLKKSVKLYHSRRDHLCALLNEHLGDVVKFSVPAGGMAIWVQFDKKYPLPILAARAAKKGLFMSDGTNYSYGSEDQNALRIGFAGFNEKEMNEVVCIIKNVIETMK